MVRRLITLLPRHPMGVVEPDEPHAIRSVQCERVVDAVWLILRYGNLRHDEPDPMAALGVHYEYLPVQIEKQIEGWVARFRHEVAAPSRGIVIILKQHNQERRSAAIVMAAVARSVDIIPASVEGGVFHERRKISMDTIRCARESVLIEIYREFIPVYVFSMNSITSL
jgi:hypothetical protein